jgi:SNF2 family DNA or RNA helicase
MISQACAGLLLDPGLGKTSITFGAFRILHDKKLVKKCLVVAPLRPCYLVWPREAKKWAEFQHLRVEILHGKDKENALARDADIYVINPEGLDWLCGRTTKDKRVVYTLERLKKLDPDMLVVDESTKFKHSDTNRFKAMRALISKMRRRYILTGTPTPNGLTDLFGQIYILDEGAALGRYITHYRTNYFYPSGYGGYEWAPQADAFDRITRRIAPLVLRMESKDYLELPERTVVDRFVELPTTARHKYDELESDLITQIEQETIVAGNAAAASVKCRQVANGGLYLNEPSSDLKINEDWVELHQEKAQSLADLVEELSGSPLLVLYQFRFDKQLIRNVLGESTPDIGECSGNKLLAVEKLFNSGSIPVLLGHPASMGHGLNLQSSCSHVCWFGLTWDLEHYEQATKRIHRQGQKNRVIVYHLIARDTVDEVIARTLRSKDKSQNALLQALKGLHRR